MTDKATLRIAHRYMAKWDRQDAIRQAEYTRHQLDMRRKGYRAQYCPHGVDVWANDFDGACYSCENGDETRLDTMRLALRLAKQDREDKLKLIGFTVDPVMRGLLGDGKLIDLRLAGYLAIDERSA